MKPKPKAKKTGWRSLFRRKTTPSWKSAPSRSRPRPPWHNPVPGWLRPLRPLLPAAIAVVLIVVIGGGLYLRYWVLERQPTNPDLPIKSCSVFDAHKKLDVHDAYGYLLMVNEQRIERVTIVHLGTDADQRPFLRTVSLPVSYWLPILDSSRFDYVTISNLLSAGEIDEADNPVCFVVKNLGYQVGTPADFVIVEEKRSDHYLSSTALLENHSPVSVGRSFWELLSWRGVSANISHLAVVNLKKQIWLADPQRTDYETPLDAYQEVINNSGDKLRILDFNQFLDKYPGALASSTIGTEQALVEVYNGTAGNGLASIYSRFLRTVGVDVIRVGNVASANYPADLDIYITNDKQYPSTLSLITKVFGNRSIRYFYRQRPTNIVTTGDIIVIIRHE